MSPKSLVFQGLKAVHRTASHLPAFGNFRPLRGSFSARDLLDHGLLDGGILATEQPIGPCPPGSMTEKAGFQQNHHQPWPIFWTRAHDARLAGRLLLWRDQNDRVCSEGVYGMPDHKKFGDDRVFSQIHVTRPERLSGAWTSITSNWCSGKNYYHWLLDGLSRLCVRDLLPEKPGILVPAGMGNFAKETLELLGLDS
ncbi:MAG: hypothetical protein ABI600_14810, partial [Luteolibacter sp.]